MKSGLFVRLLRGNEKNIDRDCFIWNMVGGWINAIEAVLLMMIVTRTNGLDDAGVLSIAFALGNLFMTIGKFGVRNYQVTDVKKEYSFNTYFTLRIISVVAMILISIGYIFSKMLFGKYPLTKAVIILGICLIYTIEAFEDVFLGLYQEYGRLDVASKVFIIRWLGILITFCLISIIKKNLIMAVIVSDIVSCICEVVLLYHAGSIIRPPIIRLEKDMLGDLAKQCFALFLSSFLTYYITNAPKYAIDLYLTETEQAYFGYISMPVFVVELLNCFIYQPQMVHLAFEWENKKEIDYKARVKKQYLWIMILSVCCLLGAYILGIPILSVVYGVTLIKFKKELIVLMLAGGALAFVGFTSVLLTIMRKQTILLTNMLIVTVLALLGFRSAVYRNGVMGVSVFYLILMIILAVLNYFSTKWYERVLEKNGMEVEK